MKYHRRLLLLFAILLLCIVSGICLAHSFNRSKRLNVILFTADSLRADHLGCYGYQRDTSPHIDMLAREGVLCKQAVAQGSHTAPSLGAILTSTLPNKHGLSQWRTALNTDLSTIAGVLKKHGYVTFFIGGGYNAALEGFDKDFDAATSKDLQTFRIAEVIKRFIRAYSGRPFFIWVHCFSTHAPYNPFPDRKYTNLFQNDRFGTHVEMPVVAVKPGQYCAGAIPQWLSDTYGGIRDPAYFIAQYDRAIRMTDDLIGKIMNVLKVERRDAQTIIIISADHGELLGEHGYYFFHSWFLYEPLIEVPLIFHCPGVIPQGKIIDVPVSAHVSIAPTILEIMKIAKPRQMDGVSLLGLMQGGRQEQDAAIFSDEGYTVKSIRKGDWKLIYNDRSPAGKKYEFYNVKEDPQELRNVYSLRESELAPLKRALDAYTQAGLIHSKKRIAIDEDTKKRLESMGYAQ